LPFALNYPFTKLLNYQLPMPYPPRSSQDPKDLHENIPIDRFSITRSPDYPMDTPPRSPNI
jgi:hypothetical protein